MDVPLTSSSTVRLILERIPFDLTETGLWNFLESRRICPLLDLRLVKRRRYRDFMERCTNHAYLTLETTEDAERFIQEIHAKPPLNLTVRIIELGEDDRPAPTYDSGEESRLKESSAQLLKSRSDKNHKMLRHANVNNSNVIRDSVPEAKLTTKPPPLAASKFEEVTIHEPKVMSDDQDKLQIGTKNEDKFSYNSPILLTDVRRAELPPCAACYQPSQYLCHENLKEAYCSRKCQVKCVITRKKIIGNDKKELCQDDGDKLCSLENDHQSPEPRNFNEKGDNLDDERDTINSSVSPLDDTNIGKIDNKSNIENTGFLMSDSDSSHESLPPFTSYRRIGHHDDTKSSGQKEGESNVGSPSPPVTRLDLLPGRSDLLSNENSSLGSTDTASLHPIASPNKDYNPFEGDTNSDTTIPLPSTDDSSYSPFTSTKMDDGETSFESPPPLRSAVAMKYPDPGQDPNGNPWLANGNVSKCHREDSTSSSDESLPPFKYFRDGENKMVPVVGQNQTLVPGNKENYLNALTNLGETINNLKIREDSSGKNKPSQVNKDTQTEFFEIPKSNIGTQTDFQRDTKGTQTSFQTAETNTQTETIGGIVRIEEKESKMPSLSASNAKDDDFSLPENDSSDPFFSLSPDDPHSYFSFFSPKTEFMAMILCYKSQSQFFICTESTFAKLKYFQAEIQLRAKRRRLIPIDRMHLKLGDLIMFKAKDSLGFGTWYRGIVTKVGSGSVRVFCPDYGFTEKVQQTYENIQPLFTNDLGMRKYFATPCETEDRINLEEGATVKVKVEGVKQRVKYVIKVI